ncbi:MAG: hypothetical protein JSC188_000888 [Candidatus Tokpelaia sp. JSC188]|nr:MAG: hypothetical protein JSC188_000888 [Candidatus Tokpelaia sp. JSC188]
MKTDNSKLDTNVKKQRDFGHGFIFIAGITGGIIALSCDTILQYTNLFHVGIKNQLIELRDELIINIALVEKEKILLSEIQKNVAKSKIMVTDIQNQARFMIDALSEIRKELSKIANGITSNQLQENIKQRISVLEIKLNELDKLKQDAALEKFQLKTLKKGGGSSREQKRVNSTDATLLIAAANALKAAVDRGDSYANELQTFSALAPLNIPLNLLKIYADKGLPSVSELSARFSRIADKITQTENSSIDNTTILKKLWSNVRKMVIVRPIGTVNGNTASAIAARMEMAITAGDYARAFNEWKTLSSRGQFVSADFMKILQGRYEIDNLLSRFIFRAFAAGIKE